eukprot:570656-Amphidinium_carterae.3
MLRAPPTSMAGAAGQTTAVWMAAASFMMNCMEGLLQKGYLLKCQSLDEVRRIVAGDLVVSKLAVLEKKLKTPTGEDYAKHMIMDRLRSGINARATQTQRVILQSPLDVTCNALQLHAFAQQAGLPGSLEAMPEALVVDIKAAFYQVPLAPRGPT